MSVYPDDLRYTKEHEWIRVEDGVATLGITDYAQGELGDIIFVELPRVGDKLVKGGAFGTVEAVKTVEEMYSPLSGEVLELNAELEATPELVNQEAYEGGWMVKLQIEDDSQLDELLDAASYRALIGE
ncbi:glycine cleavage system protein GcvH [bacterium]|nr:glycine cleavage system protein GcvH [bacterium]